MKIETLAIQSTILQDSNGSVTAPIYLSTTFERAADGSFDEHGFVYNRLDNPNRRLLESSLAALEGGSDAFTFASGLAASAALLQTLQYGDHIILPDDAYFGIIVLAKDVFANMGITTTCIRQTNLQAVQEAIQPNTRFIWVESPSNPQLRIVDITAIASIAHRNNALCVVDNTWATPVLQQPLVLGADVVMHSTTKYFGGHSDVLGGALIINNNIALATHLRKIQKVGGAVPSPFDCWLVARGIRTLPLRVISQTKTAHELAIFLEKHPAIEAVHYPFLVSHPQHDIAIRQMSAGGAMLSIQVIGGKKNAMQVASALKLFTHATSLGGVESLIEHRKSIEGDTSQTPDNLLRISVGLEHIDDIMADFGQALKKIE